MGCEFLGTGVSDLATQFPHTIQWDFHDVEPEWLDSADVIYSNSFDHSYAPQRCLDAWMPYLICRWGRGRYAVREMLDVPNRSPKLAYHAFLLIQRFDGLEKNGA